jgi:UDP-GlcNAc:undecaprenyl-phosphate GlcNAc-1-phosphate transferase
LAWVDGGPAALLASATGCGSLSLGFLLAASSLGLGTIGSPATAAVVVLLLVGPALFDVTLVVIDRVGGGRSILIRGTDHTSHRLVRRGAGTTAAVGAIALGA